METTFDSFSALLFFSQLFSIALYITAIVLGITLVLRLLKLIDSQTILNKERIRALRNKNDIDNS